MSSRWFRPLLAIGLIGWLAVILVQLLVDILRVALVEMAARAAEMRTALCLRERESPIPVPNPTDHPRIRSFAELA